MEVGYGHAPERVVLIAVRERERELRRSERDREPVRIAELAIRTGIHERMPVHLGVAAEIAQGLYDLPARQSDVLLAVDDVDSEDLAVSVDTVSEHELDGFEEVLLVFPRHLEVRQGPVDFLLYVVVPSALDGEIASLEVAGNPLHTCVALGGVAFLDDRVHLGDRLAFRFGFPISITTRRDVVERLGLELHRRRDDAPIGIDLLPSVVLDVVPSLPIVAPRLAPRLGVSDVLDAHIGRPCRCHGTPRLTTGRFALLLQRSLALDGRYLSSIGACRFGHLLACRRVVAAVGVHLVFDRGAVVIAFRSVVAPAY